MPAASRSRRIRGRQLDALERRLVWIVGSPRTGSTWLLNLVGLHPQVRAIDEPLIGAHLALPMAALVGDTSGATISAHHRVVDQFSDKDSYFFSQRYRESWQPALRDLVLARLGAEFRDLGGHFGRDYLFVKEPHGSEGADLLGAALPRARLLAIVRDGRDVVDSMLDAVAPGAWASDVASLHESAGSRTQFIEASSRIWVHRSDRVRAALASHAPERTLLVRYEDALADTEKWLRTIYRWLDLPVPTDVAEVVTRLSFASLAKEVTGSGQFARAATPGLWRDHFTSEEQQRITGIMGPTLVDLGYDI
jgi:sulfotransferase family protein